MAKKELGEARYVVQKIGKLVQVTATGQAQNFNDKFDFEQLPFFIFPPIIGFYVIHPDITLPATIPFTYSETIPYPDKVDFVFIEDAAGRHAIKIEGVEAPPILPFQIATDEAGFCVFRNINSSEHMIAKCDAIVPAIYSRAFGPATYAECEAYVAQHGGLK